MFEAFELEAVLKFISRLAGQAPCATSVAILLASVAMAGPVAAQPAPGSVVASPDVYKVIADGPQLRMVEVTWAPGQRDVMHSHPASAVYYLVDCSLRVAGADGAAQPQRDIPAGTAFVQPPIPAHSVQNVGTNTCKLIMVEQK